MSTQGEKPTPSSATSSTAAAPKGGIHAALKYTGIPASWLTKRPKLPSRNWLIFIGVTTSLIGLYAYDRKKCREIRELYVKKVEHLAQEPMGSMELPRKVTVYASKWPGDEDADRSLRYFRKYVKPILVAAAVDYEIHNGRKHGALARLISEKIKKERRIEAGLEPAPISIVPTPINLSKEEAALKALAGGSIIVGRMTFKEYMEGLRRGWTESPEYVDREDALAHALENDGRFDEPEILEPASDLDGEPIPTKSRLAPSQGFTPYKLTPTSSSHSNTNSPPSSSIPPPLTIPPQPPLLLVPFTNRIGFKQMPLMVVDFFNQRQKVQAGAEAAYRLVLSHTRPIVGPLPNEPSAPLFSPDERSPITDLDFDREGESYYVRSLSTFREDITKAREDYYAKLPDRLATARALARGEREPTEEEQNAPPPTEVELRAERLKKETRWQDNEEGWDIVRPESNVAWDERFRTALKVFTDPPASDTSAKEDNGSNTDAS